MLLSRSEWKKRATSRAEASARLKEMARELWTLGPEDALTASEIACPDPGCPDTETVILVMRHGARTRAFKVLKPIGEVTRDDLAGLRDEEGAP